MFNRQKFFDHLPVLVVYFIAAAFSIKGLREPDLWWQIRTGEWIIENGSVPKTDVFSFTFEGTPWINVKWLSEVLYAVITAVSSPECVFILQCVVALLLVAIMVKWSKTCTVGEAPPWIVAVVVLLTLVGLEYRMIGRPEMFTHLFASVFLWTLWKFGKTEDKRLYALIVLQILWANLHEGFGTGIVLTAIFAAGAWLEYFFTAHNILTLRKNKPITITAVLALQVLSVMINPNGYLLLLQPLRIFGQVFENKYTTELFDFRSPEYWQWNTYWVLGLLVLSVLGNAFYFAKQKAKASKHLLFVNHYGLGYLLSVLAFVYLASTAYRNIALLVLVLFPFLSSAANALFSANDKVRKNNRVITVICIVLFLGFYALVVSNQYYKITGSRDVFGMQVLENYNPVQTADFIKTQDLNRKCFSDYLTSSYLMWRLQPEFKTYIDLRDLDVFPSSFFSTFAEAVNFPDSFEKQDSVYKFGYVVLYRPQFASLHRHLYSNSRFKLIHLDQVAAVYAPKDFSEKAFVPRATDGSALANVINRILNPFWKKTNAQEEISEEVIRASYFISVGDMRKAEQNLLQTSSDYRALQMRAELRYNQALKAETDSGAVQRDKYFAEAAALYQQAILMKDDYAPSYLGLGAVLFRQQNYVAALENFDQAIRLDPMGLNGYLFAAECCKIFVNRNNEESADYTNRAIGYLRKAEKLNPDNPTMMMNIGFLYFRLSDCKNVKAYLEPIQNFDGFGTQERNSIRQALNNCK